MKHHLGIQDFSGTFDPHILFPNGSRIPVRESNFKGFVQLKFKKHTVPLGMYRELCVNLCDANRNLDIHQSDSYSGQSSTKNGVTSTLSSS